MNFKQLEQNFIDQLRLLYGEEEAKEMYGLVVHQISGWGRTQLLMNAGQEVLPNDYLRYNAVLEELKSGKPLQHILEEAWFYGLKFKVSDAVLIPRPETEELVQWILQSLPKKGDRHRHILDIGTGSGCIAVALKKNSSLIDVHALDVSEAALAIAKFNALTNEADINFIHADILSYRTERKYDLIVSNPPYIKEDEMGAMHQNVLRYEPHLALFVTNDNPLIFYKSIADFATINLTDGGMLFFEINEYLGEETLQLLEDKGFVNIVLKQDMQGKDRMICCNWLC